MTKEELLERLNDIEWKDFEIKEASGGIPKSMWETVSAFSNTEGGWIILGVKEKKIPGSSVYVVNGVPNPEQMEQDIITTLRSRTKFNAPISCKAARYKIVDKDILAFEIPLSPHRPVAIKSNGEVYVRTGSGDSYATASQRYTYRMPEQENIWESFLLIMHRLRNFVDAPYVEGPDIFGVEDNSQLFCLREGLVNFCAHSDYFASAHPTIRVFDDRIVMQNPGRFILDADEFRSRVLSMPRNPSIIRLFRHPKLSENAGYGIDKILGWKKLTGKSVSFESDMLISTVTYPLASTKYSRNAGENSGENGENNDENKVLEIIRKAPNITQPQIAIQTGFSTRKVNRIIASLRKKEIITRVGKTKGGHWEILSD